MKILKYAAGLLAAAAVGFGIYRLESRRPMTELERAGVSLIAADDGVIQSVSFHQVEARDEYLQYVARLKTVSAVYLCNRRLTGEGLAALASLPALKRLDLANSHADSGSLAAVSRIASLRFLNLSHCSWVTDDELAQLDPALQLESLQLEGCPITDAGMAHLCRLSALQSVGLGDCTSLSEAGLRKLSALQRLEDLTLDGLTLTQPGVRCLELFPKLRTVSLRGIRVPRHDLLQLMSGPHPLTIDINAVELAELAPLYDLGATIRFNDQLEAALVILGGTAPNGNVPLNDETLPVLLQFPSVKGLSLTGVAVTDEGLRLISRLPQLREIRLQDLPITDHGIEYLAELPHLTTLSLRNCPLTGERLAAFHGTGLTDLTIHTSTGLTPAGLQQIGSLHDLRSLRIHGPLPAAGWEDIAALPQLEHLVLLGCAFTAQVAESLAASRSLNSLRVQDSEFSDHALAACSALPQGCRLELANCRFSRDALEQLSVARPDLTVMEDVIRPGMVMPR